MEGRIEQELALLRQRFPKLEYRAEGRWVLISEYPLPSGWNRTVMDVAFQIPVGYPGTPPYGIYVPPGLTFGGAQPDNYTAASNVPPFGGTWWVFSWTTLDGQWHAGAEPLTGSNLLNWVVGFAERFREGK